MYIASQVRRYYFFMFGVFQGLPSYVFISSGSFSEGLAVFEGSATPYVIVGSGICFFFATGRVSLLADQTGTAGVYTIVECGSLSSFPIFCFLTCLCSLSNGLVSAG